MRHFYFFCTIISIAVVAILLASTYHWRGDSEVYASSATAPFTATTIVSSVASGSAVNQIDSFNKDGVFYVAFTSTTGANIDMFYTTSTDGLSWSNPTTLQTGIEESFSGKINFQYSDQFGAYIMTYVEDIGGFSHITIATSTDLSTWATSSLRSLTQFPDGDRVCNGDHDISISQTSQQAAVACAVSASGTSTRHIFLLTSSDLSTWATSTLYTYENSSYESLNVAVDMHGASGSEEVRTFFDLSASDFSSTTLYQIDGSLGGPYGSAQIIDTIPGAIAFPIFRHSKDSAGLQSILYGNYSESSGTAATGTLYIAEEQGGGSWTTSTITTYAGQNAGSMPAIIPFSTDILINENDDQTILYVDAEQNSDNLSMYVGINTSSSWTTVRLDTPAFATMSESQTLYNTSTGQFGYVYIANGALMYGTLVYAASPLANTNLTTTGVTVNWTDNAVNEDSYQVVIYNGNDTNGTIATSTGSLPADTTSTNFTGLTQNSDYTAVVLVSNALASATTTFDSFTTASGASPTSTIATAVGVSGNQVDTSLIYRNNQYYAYFASTTASGEQIHLATSTDGSTWSTPTVVIADLLGDSADSFAVYYSEQNNFFAMAYQSVVGIASVTNFGQSTNGVSWTTSSMDSVFTLGELICTGSTDLAFSANSTLGAYACRLGAASSTESRVLLATTTDYLSWTTSTVANFDTGSYDQSMNDIAVEIFGTSGAEAIHVTMFYDDQANGDAELWFATTTVGSPFSATSTISDRDLYSPIPFALRTEGQDQSSTGTIRIMYPSLDAISGSDPFDVTGTIYMAVEQADGSFTTSSFDQYAGQVTGLPSQFEFDYGPGDIQSVLYMGPVNTGSALRIVAGTDTGSGWTTTTLDTTAASYDIKASIAYNTANEQFGFLYGAGGELRFATIQANNPLPDAPSSIAATSITDTGVTITWTDNASDETSYKVLLYNGTGTGGTVAASTTIAANSTSASFTGLISGSTYTSQIVVTNAAGSVTTDGSSFATTGAAPNVSSTIATSVGAGTDIEVEALFRNGLYYVYFVSTTALGDQIHIVTSADGSAWSNPVIHPDIISNKQLHMDLEYSEFNNFFALAYIADIGGNGVPLFATSSDGISWTTSSVASAFIDPDLNCVTQGDIAFASASSLAAYVCNFNDNSSPTSTIEVAMTTDYITWTQYNVFTANTTTNGIVDDATIDIYGTAGSEVVTVIGWHQPVDGDGDAVVFMSTSSPAGPFGTTTTISGTEISNPTPFTFPTLVTDQKSTGALTSFYSNLTSAAFPDIVFERFYAEQSSPNGTSWTTSSLGILEGDFTEGTLYAADILYGPSDIGATLYYDGTVGSPYKVYAAINTSSSWVVTELDTDSMTGKSDGDIAYHTTREQFGFVYSAGGELRFTTISAEDPLPTAPSSIAATSITDTGVTINWTDNADNETGYTVLLYNGTGTGGTVASSTTVAANSSTAAFVGLSSGSNYTPQIVVTNANGSVTTTGSTFATTGTASSVSSTIATAVGDSDTVEVELLYQNGFYYAYFTSTTASGDRIHVSTSTDGNSWSDHTVIPDALADFEGGFDVEYSASNNFFAMSFGEGTATPYFATSSDGITWTSVSLGATFVNGSAQCNSHADIAFSLESSLGAYVCHVTSGTTSSEYLMLATTNDYITWTTTTVYSMNTTTEGSVQDVYVDITGSAGSEEIKVISLFEYVAVAGNNEVFISTTTVGNSFGPTSTISNQDVYTAVGFNLTTFASRQKSTGLSTALYTGLDSLGFPNATATTYLAEEQSDGSWTTSTFALLEGLVSGEPSQYAISFGASDVGGILYMGGTVGSAVQVYAAVNTTGTWIGTSIDTSDADFNIFGASAYNTSTEQFGFVYGAGGQLRFVSITAEDPNPTAASGLSTGSITTSTVTASWTDNADDETGYTVILYSGVGTGGAVATSTTVTANSTSVNFVGLTPGNTYTLQVVVTNAYSSATTTGSSFATDRDLTVIDAGVSGSLSTYSELIYVTDKYYLAYTSSTGIGIQALMTTSSDGTTWSTATAVSPALAVDGGGHPYNVDFEYSATMGKFALTYTEAGATESNTIIANSNDAFTWSTLSLDLVFSLLIDERCALDSGIALSSASSFATIACVTTATTSPDRKVIVATTTDFVGWSSSTVYNYTTGSDVDVTWVDVEMSGTGGSELISVLYESQDGSGDNQEIFISTTTRNNAFSTPSSLTGSDIHQPSFGLEFFQSTINSSGEIALVYLIVSDASGFPAVTGTTNLAIQSSDGSWATSTFDAFSGNLTGIPYSLDLSYGPGDISTVVYSDSTFGNSMTVYVSVNTSGSWVATQLDTDALTPRVETGIAYDTTNSKFGYVYGAGSQLRFTSIAAAESVMATPTISVAVSTSSAFTGTSASTINLNEAATTSVWAHVSYQSATGCGDALNGNTSDDIDITVALNYNGDGFTTDGSDYICPNTLMSTPTDSRLTNTCYAGRVENTIQSGHEAAAVSCTHSCSTATTTSAITISCQFDLQHYTTYNGYASSSMGVVVYANNGTATTTATTSLPIQSLTAMVITTATTTSYGTLAPYATSSELTTVVKNTGNTPIDVNISGTAMSCADVGSIPVSQFRFSTTTGFSYASGTPLIPSGTQLFDVNLSKQTSTSTLSTLPMYSQVVIPTGALGVCTNQFTLSGALGS